MYMHVMHNLPMYNIIFPCTGAAEPWAPQHYFRHFCLPITLASFVKFPQKVLKNHRYRLWCAWECLRDSRQMSGLSRNPDNCNADIILFKKMSCIGPMFKITDLNTDQFRTSHLFQHLLYLPYLTIVLIT